MSPSRIEQVRAVMPPEGTDLIDVFGPNAAQIDTGGLVRDDAAVNMVARNAERTTEGPEGFREIWADWLEPWESYRIYFDDVIERGDRVIMLVRLRGVTKHDGVEMEHEAAGIFRFEGDQVVEMEFNLDREDALKD
jgi:ketosteroid isomerase-like protein